MTAPAIRYPPAGSFPSVPCTRIAGSAYAIWSFFKKIAHVFTKQAATAARRSSSGFAAAAGSPASREPAIGIVRPASGSRIAPVPEPSPLENLSGLGLFSGFDGLRRHRAVGLGLARVLARRILRVRPRHLSMDHRPVKRLQMLA